MKTNRKLIALAREHATYDIPYSTTQLLNDLADALEEFTYKRGQRAKLPLYEDATVPQVVLDLIKPFEQKSNIPHWIIEDKGFGGMYIECSVCGARWCDLFDKKIPRSYDPCPVCGAQMDEDAEEYI